MRRYDRLSLLSSTKKDANAYRRVSLVSSMLFSLVENEIRILIDQLLHRVLNKFVKRIQLLTDKTFLIEKRGNHSPTIFLSNIVASIVVIISLGIAIIWVRIGIRICQRSCASAF